MAVQENAPVPGTPEYDQAMIAKAEKAFQSEDDLAAEKAEAESKAAEASTENRPEWLPEKFESPEALAKAYAELEKQQGSKPKTEEQPKEVQENPEENPQEALASVGVDYEALHKEFTESGSLSEDSYKLLQEKAGLDKDTVDGYIAGQAALAREARTRAFDIAGGESEYTNMVTWAKSNLTPAEIAAYDKNVNGTAEEVALAVAGLKGKYVAAKGSDPALLGGGASTVTAEGFQSRAEMTAAMRDPRYKSDPAYRKQIEQKVAVSNIF
jgi:hypothetical protein